MRNPNLLLIVITVLSLGTSALSAMRLADLQTPAITATPTPTPAPTPTATPADPASESIPLGRDNARLVYDEHCAGGIGQQWLERVPDGQGGTNLVILGSCK